eukprot:TRINITY_DN492_c0_g1_i8.p1 TRINITY_DN492_c0_g1~~TRINITY_DN492_c0_g1_i8.p1  ORF type:complete len:382 (-),score=54.46 TRINITY_DN492_c0_g1_i8:39-1184(-)
MLIYYKVPKKKKKFWNMEHNNHIDAIFNEWIKNDVLVEYERLETTCHKIVLFKNRFFSQKKEGKFNPRGLEEKIQHLLDIGIQVFDRRDSYKDTILYCSIGEVPLKKIYSMLKGVGKMISPERLPKWLTEHQNYDHSLKFFVWANIGLVEDTQISRFGNAMSPHFKCHIRNERDLLSKSKVLLCFSQVLPEFYAAPMESVHYGFTLVREPGRFICCKECGLFGHGSKAGCSFSDTELGVIRQNNPTFVNSKFEKAKPTPAVLVPSKAPETNETATITLIKKKENNNSANAKKLERRKTTGSTKSRVNTTSNAYGKDKPIIERKLKDNVHTVLDHFIQSGLAFKEFFPGKMKEIDELSDLFVEMNVDDQSLVEYVKEFIRGP